MMPNHQDRVRRNYHDIKLFEHTDFKEDSQVLTIFITKMDIATAISKRDIENIILRKIQKEIREQYHETKPRTNQITN